MDESNALLEILNSVIEKRKSEGKPYDDVELCFELLKTEFYRMLLLGLCEQKLHALRCER